MTTSAPPAIRLGNLRKSFGRLEIIRGVDLSVETGEIHAVIGPNGAGKSTLFNLISGRLRPSSGTIELGGVRSEGRAPEEVAALGLSRSFQVSSIFRDMSVFENLRCALFQSCGKAASFWRSVDTDDELNGRTDELLCRIGLEKLVNTAAGEITYADQRALEVGITIAGGAKTILLDEPTAGMSKPEAEHMVQLIRTVARGRTVVIVEHDMGIVFGLADRVSVLVYGEVVATGTPGQIRSDAAVQEAYLGAEAT
jgi:branched-chain amino acid transport system ATP-binding protein